MSPRSPLVMMTWLEYSWRELIGGHGCGIMTAESETNLTWLLHAEGAEYSGSKLFCSALPYNHPPALHAEPERSTGQTQGLELQRPVPHHDSRPVPLQCKGERPLEVCVVCASKERSAQARQSGHRRLPAARCGRDSTWLTGEATIRDIRLTACSFGCGPYPLRCNEAAKAASDGPGCQPRPGRAGRCQMKRRWLWFLIGAVVVAGIVLLVLYLLTGTPDLRDLIPAAIRGRG